MIYGHDYAKWANCAHFSRSSATARYAMTREVAACKQPVFPLSMSDFKPGDKDTFVQSDSEIGPLCEGLARSGCRNRSPR